MIGFARPLRVFAYARPVDQRKSFDTLGAIVREGLGRHLLDGSCEGSLASARVAPNPLPAHKAVRMTRPSTS